MTLRVRIDRLPLARAFAISRGARTEQVVVMAEIAAGGAVGRGECSPYARYDETPEGVAAQAEAMGGWLDGALTGGPATAREMLLDAMPPCAARNALDCALWDLEARQTGRRVWEIAGIAAPARMRSVLTLSMDTPDAMAEAARALPTDAIKIKVGARDGEDGARIAAIRAARPDAWLMTDANEGWTEAELPALLDAARDARIDLVEQPLAQGAEPALRRLREAGALDGLVLCADESCSKDAEIAELSRTYDAVNLKLDKTGGLTKALRDAQTAREAGMSVMVGCMLGSSLAMAPGAVLAAASGADPVDLDGPLWLARDRDHGILAEDGTVSAPEPGLWG
ncbi:N-acetyl-D-Glu racemase DgcA [Jannaschia aquimarina]|uniref:Dipeptide epimerase n=1 Tax=Jannaschia aquimarina TaxID=935700 RepID=A0A0D1CT59_9RHOB|nr:N-acetyl-D-Glu racemase DgcA [Jannaschia aquimarina]KIT17952.1 L-Ala-D/L-Glu epimerase [Jannaschia aquimarina]SNT08197.1 L-alanine-DL-glutamate epimerase [Jannaschia aquimarina]